MFKLIKKYKENLFWLLFSFLGAPFFYGLSLIHRFRRGKRLKILVIQTAKIGDLVCSTPVFREIKKVYPESFLSVLVTPQTKDILKYNPHIDEIFLLNHQGEIKLVQEIKQRQFDWSFSLVPGISNTIIPFWAGIPHRVSTISKYASRTTKLLSVFNNYRLKYKRDTLALRHYLKLLKFIKINEFSEKKEVFISPQETKKALQSLKEHNLGPDDFLVGISVTAGKKFKQWSPEKFAQLADRLIDQLKTKIIFTGNSKDESDIKKVQSLMNNQSVKVIDFNLIELAGLLSEMSIFISVDTGPLYIADALDIPVIDIIGPHSKASQRPSNKAVIVQKKIPCQPCSFIMSAPGYCREGHLRCIRDIRVDDVFEAIKKSGFQDLKFSK